MHSIFKYIFIPFFLSPLIVFSAQITEKNHFTIAIDPEYIPFTQKDIDGQPVGLLVDFWNLWAKENGYIVEYKFYPWEKSLQVTQNGEVDFHSGTTKDRVWMHASNPIYEVITAMFSLNEFTISTTRDLVGKRIGTIDTYYGELAKKALGEKIEIINYTDYIPMVEALKEKEVDVIIDDVEAIRYFLIKTGQMNKIKRIDIKELQFVNKIYAITNANNKGVLSQINKGLKNLDLIDLVNIEETWLPRIEDAYYNRKLSEKIKYTPKEEEWIATEKNISVTGDPLWKYSEYTQKDIRYRGVAGDYTAKFSEKVQKEFILKPIESWAELLATPDRESADIVMGMMNHQIKKLLEEKYDFLQPYIVGPLVIIMDKNIRFITDLSDVKNRRIGVLDLQNYTEAIEYHYEAYAFHYYPKVDNLLDDLLYDKLDAVILPLPEAIVALSDHKYEGLDIIGKMENKVYIDIGILKNKPLLKNIMNKVTQSMGRSDKKKILSKWTHQLNYIEKIDYKLTFMIAGLLGFLLISAMYYAHLLWKKHEYEKEFSKKLESLALKDDLTGLMNKRAFNQIFEQHIDEDSSMGLLFIDIDYFKSYNDLYGHLSGDSILKQIAKEFESFQSKKSLPYRIGGEEFGYILYDCSEISAKEFAQKICDTIAQKRIEHKKSPWGYITVSIGISVDRNNTNRHNLYAASDEALYTAKKLGRNQIFFKPFFMQHYDSLCKTDHSSKGKASKNNFSIV